MNRMHLLASTLACVALVACSTAPRTFEGKADIRKDAATALAVSQKEDATLTDALHRAAGYAVFPSVGKGAAGVGGAYGRGVLYEQGQVVGYCDMSQATVGLQLGGQSFTEVICFEHKDALNRFKRGDFAFDAQASAVALEAGSGANADYSGGVQVFTTDEKGAMVEASIGGQKFTYQPL